MIELRSFRNGDPPRLADVWRCADLGPAALQPMTSALLEAGVFSKPYFDRRGLLVACEGPRIIGFAHAAFGPNEAQTAIDTECGSTLLVAIVPHAEQEQIGARLLSACEDYLRLAGARRILGGGCAAMRSFYLGLYGGADLPGILDSSATMQGMFRRAGYGEAARISVLRRTLSGFRPPVNRQQLSIRRTTQLRVIDEPARRTWWEAATTTGVALRRYDLHSGDGQLLGSATFWDMQPLAGAWGLSASGLLHIHIDAGRRREGLAHYLLGEALYDLGREGVAIVETQAPEENLPARALFAKLGFEAAESGTLFCKA